MSAPQTNGRALQFVGDLSQLPAHGHSHRSLTWWGMMGLICVEGTALALAVVAYLYLSGHEQQWPPQQILPSPAWGSA